jgi:glyoxalase family protein
MSDITAVQAADAAATSLTGIHHVSALSAHIGRTRDFFVRVLGMRPVIRTVNQDDPSMYHLFFGDGAGTPGSDMTFFDLPRAARERRGNNSLSCTTLRVAGESALEYWAARLAAHGITHEGIRTRDERRVLDFDDPEGTRFALIDDGGVGAAFPWDESPVQPEYQIRGLGYTTLTVPALPPTERFLVDALGLRPDRTYPLDEAPRYLVHVYAMGDGGPSAEVHVIVRDDLARAAYGAGGVHHVALRVPDGGQRPGDWVARLEERGYRNSGVIDRHYFTSVYVREPNHVLFELATDGPGFEVDGPMDGERLSLPPSLEPRRAEIEAKLAPLD